MTRIVPLLLLSTSVFGQTDWPSFGNDPGAMRYRPINQNQIWRSKPDLPRVVMPGLAGLPFDNDAGPEVVGGRPRDFQRPRSEPTRSRAQAVSSNQNSWWSNWFGGR